ncbi:putative PPC domain-containing protein [Lupinus albus]|uniref:AT-hook motif nuclear-localized protein n=1 Tax=Lupinus albus TaxID=3870 RepID=A0A6A4NNR3_LUPAL|nr:putative PPC domain-containing protein [Lupinus albus]
MEMKDITVSSSPLSTSLLPQMMNLNMNNTLATTTLPQPEPATAITIATTKTTVPEPETTKAITTITTTVPGSVVDSLGKKKRGRPRKYDSEGNLRVSSKPQQGFSMSLTSPPSSSKRGRGKPFGFNNFHLLGSSTGLFGCTAGRDFTPHVVTIHTGEDVAAKIFSFVQRGPVGVCILSANGAISKVTLRQPGSSGAILTYEGRFEILSLSGSFTVSDNGSISPTNILSVSLAGPDGRVIGGGVAGLLTAACPIQVVIGSFMPNGYKTQKRKYNREHSSGAKFCAADIVTAPSPRPISQQNSDATLIAADWNGSGEFSDHGPSPDINISLNDD